MESMKSRFRNRAASLFLASLLSLSMAAGGFSARAQAAATAPSAAQPAPILFAKFETSLSTKKARVGDEVRAKTIKDLHLKDLDIPKGSRIVGTVSAVQSRKEGNGDSSLSIRFDRIEMRGNRVLRIQGIIVSIGEIAGDNGLGPTSVLSRGGVGATAGVDPNLEVDRGVQDDIPPGSTLPGVGLGTRLSPDGATELRGIKTEIKFDSDTEIKVALFRGR
jgi:hypothetical protein